MENDLIVVSCCNKPGGFMPLFIQQLGQVGIAYHNEFLPVHNIMELTIGLKIEVLRYFSNKYSNFKRIVLSDAWDVLFYGAVNEVIYKIPEDRVILAAERNCFPDKSITDQITGTTPWKFANGGLTAGSPNSILEFCRNVEIHPMYDQKAVDQGWYNSRLVEKDSLLNLDTTGKLFYCMYDETNDLTAINGRPYNSLSETFPNFIHFNGRWPIDKFSQQLQSSKISL